MTFGDSAILTALAAVAIPVAIHLLARRRARRVLLPTLQFAAGAHAASQGWRRLKQTGLLMLRMAVMALFVLALARPQWGGGSGAAAGPWILCLDASPSMRVRVEGGGTALDRGREALRQVAATLPDDTPAAVVLTGGRQAVGTAAEAQEALRRVAADTGAEEPLGRLVERAMKLVPAPGKDSPPVHLVVATDATPWGLRDVTADLFKSLPADVTILAVGAETPNVWLGLPKCRVVRGPQGRSLEVAVPYRSTDPTARPTIEIEVAAGSKSIARPAPDDREVRFVVAATGDGPWQGRVSAGTDAFPEDNVRYFTVAEPPTVRVLVVDAAREPGAALRSADLVAAAFAGESGSPKPLARCHAAEVTAAVLAEADVVFWVGSEAPATIETLAAFLARGAVVWVPADPTPPATALAAVLGGTVEATADVPDGVTIDPAGYASPLLAAFEGGTSGDLGAPVFRRRLVLADAGGDAIRFRDGPPALVELRRDGGRAVLLAVGPSPTWGDLAGRAEWVVLVQSLAEGLAPGGDSIAAGAETRRAMTGKGRAMTGRGRAVAANYILGRDLGPGQAGIRGEPGNYGPSGRGPGAVEPAAEAAGYPLPQKNAGGGAGSPAASAAGSRTPTSKTAGANAPMYYSINLDPDDTADLSPQVERLAAAFAAERLTVRTPGSGALLFKAPDPGLPARPVDLTAACAIALAALLAVETLVAARRG